MSRPKTYDHLRSLKKPITQRITLCFDPDVQAEWLEAKQLVDGARESVRFRPDDAVAARILEDAMAELAAARSKIDKVSTTFIFRSLGRRRFDQLIEEHPPTSKQLEDAKKRGEGKPQFNVDSLPQVLIAESCTAPELTHDDVKDMWDSDDWSAGELGMLFDTAWAVNQRRQMVDLGKD